MPITVERVGGTFGHDITPEKLARYKQLAQGAPEKARYWMNKMIEMVEVFRQTPASTLPGIPNPATENAVTRDGRKIPKSNITPLEEEEVRRIWDYVPWPEELQIISEILEGLEPEKANRNVAARENWRKAIRDHIFSEHFPGHSMAEFDRRNAAMKEAIAALQRRLSDLSLSDPTVQALVQSLFPGQTLDQHRDRVRRYNEAVRKALEKGGNPPIPRPVLENTDLRDAFGNLRWWAGQLCLDREPLTHEQLWNQ